MTINDSVNTNTTYRLFSTVHLLLNGGIAVLLPKIWIFMILYLSKVQSFDLHFISGPFIACLLLRYELFLSRVGILTVL